MSHNNYIYRFCLASEQALREAAGYVGGQLSEDGLLVVGGKNDTDMSLGDLTVPIKTAQFEHLDNWPFASHEEALLVKNTNTKTVDGITFGIY